MADTYLTRETLLKRLKSTEDELSWEDFMLYYRRFIYSIINKMGIGENDCDDLFQKVALKIWQALPDFDYNQKQGQFRSWIYKITQNTVLTFVYDNKYKLAKEPLIKVEMGDNHSQPEIEKIISSEWEKHISALAFNSIKKKVSEVAMDAFLQGLEGESVENASKRLGISESSVYVYRMRVKNSLTAEIRNFREMLE